MSKFPAPNFDDPEVLRALEGSIQKWRNIVAQHGGDNGTVNCPLCQLFYYTPLLDDEGNVLDECCGCPVSFATQFSCCEGTPYGEWRIATAKHKGAWPLTADTPELIALAQKELDFLLSLHPDPDTVPDHNAEAEQK